MNFYKNETILLESLNCCLSNNKTANDRQLCKFFQGSRIFVCILTNNQDENVNLSDRSSESASKSSILFLSSTPTQ